MAQLLLGNGVNIVGCSEGLTISQIAASPGGLKMVQLLLVSRVNIEELSGVDIRYCSLLPFLETDTFFLTNGD